MKRQRNRNLRDWIEKLTGQRDAVASLLNKANAEILELRDQIVVLESRFRQVNVIANSEREKHGVD